MDGDEEIPGQMVLRMLFFFATDTVLNNASLTARNTVLTITVAGSYFKQNCDFILFCQASPSLSVVFQLSNKAANYFL